MSRILIRSGKDPFVALSHEASLERYAPGIFGANMGNFLFAHSVTRAISTVSNEIVSDSLLTERHGVTDSDIDRINSEFDAFVVPMANAFRPVFEGPLRRLTNVISRLKIPVVVAGVGTQTGLDGKIASVPDSVKQASKEFVAAVLDRSASIGVRGEITHNFLRALGIPDDGIDVIGCPSLFMNGSGLRVAKKTDRITDQSRIAVSASRHVEPMTDFINRHMVNYPNLNLVAQDRATLAFMLWGEVPANKDLLDMPMDVDHPLYEQDRIRFFVDSSSWIKWMSEQSFAFGSRIHGVISSLIAGTPGLLLAHDSRTLELAEWHRIPYLLSGELSAAADFQELFDDLDLSEFNSAFDEKFEAFRQFLDRNDLENIYREGHENPEYDAKLAEVDFPETAHSLLAPGEAGRKEVAERIAWLHRFKQPRLERIQSTYVPPLPTSAEDGVRSMDEVLKELEAQRVRVKEVELVLARITESIPVRVAIRVRRMLLRLRRRP